MFDYQAGRAGAHVRAFLDGWSGQLMVDDYVGYKALFTGVGGQDNTPPRIIELACMAHARRKFLSISYLPQTGRAHVEAVARFGWRRG